MILTEKDFIENTLLLKDGDVIESEYFNWCGEGFKQRIVRYNSSKEKYFLVGGTPDKPLLNTVQTLVGKEFKVIGNINNKDVLHVGDLKFNANRKNENLKSLGWFIDLCHLQFITKDDETFYDVFYNHFMKHYKGLNMVWTGELEEKLNEYYLID